MITKQRDGEFIIITCYMTSQGNAKTVRISMLMAAKYFEVRLICKFNVLK